MSAFTIAFQVPNLVRSLFADQAIQAALVPVFTELLEQRQRAGGVPPRLDADLPRRADPRRDHRALHPRRAGGDAPLRAGLRGRDLRPHGRALADSVPDPAAARRLGARRRDPQQLRALRGVRARPAVLEHRDHRGARRARAGVPRGGPDLRLRDRGRRRHRGPARDPLLGPAQHAVSPPARVRLAQPGGAPGAAADAPGDDQPRADQRQPASSTASSARSSPTGARRRSTRRSASTCCPRGCSRSP